MGYTVNKDLNAPHLRVKLLQEHIDRGRVKTSSYCMFAEAIKDTYQHASRVQVDINTMRFTDNRNGHRMVYTTPDVCKALLIMWDEGIKPEPMDFTLTRGQVTDGTVAKRSNAEAFKRQKEIKMMAGVPKLTGGKAPPRFKIGSESNRMFGMRNMARAFEKLGYEGEFKLKKIQKDDDE